MNISIAIHGGAGTILASKMTNELEANYRKGLQDALNIGYDILKQGGSSLDAVEASVKSMEDFPLFNAGKGSVFNNKGAHEMDASIMYGKTLEAGAVSSVSNIKNPIVLAKTIMQKSEHVFLCKEGAEEFAKLNGIEFENDAYFYNDTRYQQWQEIKDSDTFQLDHTDNKHDKK
jgi:beta-aspartyl-peptidase (threonine type)